MAVLKINNNGTWETVVSIKGAQGNQGAQGIQGIQGVPGQGIPEDPENDGVYKLVATVETEDEEQTTTISWEEDVSEGPIDYKGGTHIEIGEEDTIHSTEFDLISTILGSGTGIYGGFVGSTYDVSTGEDFVSGLTKGITTHSIYGGLDVNLSELYDIGIRYIKTITPSNTTGTTTQSSTTITAEDDSDITIDRYACGLKQGDTLYIYSSISNLRAALMYDLTKAIQYKNNYTNFSGFRLSSYLDGIDSALTARIPDALVSTDTAPSVNNTINWVYS